MQTSIRWACPTELTADERRVAQALHRIGKFYVFLREVRAELFDEAFQAELAGVYQPRGTAPVPPALLAMVTLLQAYDQVGDADAVVTAQMDKRWQLVLDCLGASEAPFSQGVLVKFRERMIAHDLDRTLLARTIALAKRTGKFGWQHLQAALDSSPLLGAGRIQDTWNLIGRALSAVVTCAATAVGRPRAQVIADAGLTTARRLGVGAGPIAGDPVEEQRHRPVHRVCELRERQEQHQLHGDRDVQQEDPVAPHRRGLDIERDLDQEARQPGEPQQPQEQPVERAERQARIIAKGSETPALGARRKTGTDLD